MDWFVLINLDFISFHFKILYRRDTSAKVLVARGPPPIQNAILTMITKVKNLNTSLNSMAAFDIRIKYELKARKGSFLLLILHHGSFESEREGAVSDVGFKLFNQ